MLCWFSVKIENQWQLDILYFYFWKYILDLTKSSKTLHPFKNPNEAASTIGVHVICGCILIRQLFHRQICGCFKYESVSWMNNFPLFHLISLQELQFSLTVHIWQDSSLPLISPPLVTQIDRILLIPGRSVIKILQKK